MNNQAYKMLGDYYRLGRGGVAKNVDKAILWYSKAAMHWYMKAHKLGLQEAKYKIVDLYEHGLGIEKK